MTPYFETVKSFADVSIGDDGVDTSAFLEASDGLVLLFDLLGNGVFAFVQNDIRGNIAGVRERFNAHRDASGTLESLVVCEKQNHVPPAPLKGIPCLVRLIRGLAFSCKALQNMQEDRHCDLHICFKRSYDAVLRHHHNFAIRAVVAIAIRAVPRRDDFYHRIAQGGSKEKLDTELTKWLCGLDTIVSRMTAFLQDGGYGRV